MLHLQHAYNFMYLYTCSLLIFLAEHMYIRICTRTGIHVVCSISSCMQIAHIHVHVLTCNVYMYWNMFPGILQVLLHLIWLSSPGLPLSPPPLHFHYPPLPLQSELQEGRRPCLLSAAASVEGKQLSLTTSQSFILHSHVHTCTCMHI